MKSSEKEALEHAGIEESDVQEIPEPEIQNHEVGIRVKQSTHIGPLPDPETLAGYERIFPGAAERILRQSEDQTRHRQKIERKIAAHNNFQGSFGAVASFLLPITALLVGAYIILQGLSIAGLGTIMIGIIPIVGYLVGKKKRNDYD